MDCRCRRSEHGECSYQPGLKWVVLVGAPEIGELERGRDVVTANVVGGQVVTGMSRGCVVMGTDAYSERRA